MRCSTCGSVRPKNPDQGFWWDCWPCVLCARYVCNVPDLKAGNPCYVAHMIKHHAHVYELKEPK